MEENLMEPMLYRVDQVAQILQVSHKTVRRLLDAGELAGHNSRPGKKGLRILAASVSNYIKKHLNPLSV